MEDEVFLVWLQKQYSLNSALHNKYLFYFRILLLHLFFHAELKLINIIYASVFTFTYLSFQSMQLETLYYAL